MTDSAKTVLNDEGVFSACMTRQSVCNYSCCKFREDEWIMLLPGEYELAQQQNMKFGHLNIVNKGHAIYADCLKPCQSGDFKPVDCSWYPLFPANASATLFLATDNRKCPIPIDELVEKMLDVQAAFPLNHQNLLHKYFEKSQESQPRRTRA